ncbi:MAG: hypothetical protein ACI4JS_01190 [Oscillospiraceae bacterium]
MGVLKYNSVRWVGGVDIQNTLDIPRPTVSDSAGKAVPEAGEPEKNGGEAEGGGSDAPKSRFSAEEILVQRETEIILKQRELERMREELTMLREQYVEQGKNVILEAKRRAEGIIRSAEEQSNEIINNAQQQRDDVLIKARQEGFEHGKKDGVAAVMSAGQSVLDEARDFAEQINVQKAELFERYEKEIYDTVMDIANKVTMNSMSVKDGTAAKKLIKKAAKEFRNSQIIRITLDENGASTELAGDYEFLKEVGGGIAHVEVELLADAEPGTVIVDNGEEITDAGIQTQLKMIQELGKGMFGGGLPKRKRSKKSQAAEETVDDSEDEE